MRWYQCIVFFCGFLLALVGCGSTRVPAPIVDRTQPTAGDVPTPSRTVDRRRVATASIETKSPVTPAPVVAKPTKPEVTRDPPLPAPDETATPETVSAPDEPYRKGDWRPEYYAVRKGDTLYGIALDFGRDYRELADWNQLADPAYIQIGQRLRLFPLAGEEGAHTPEPVALEPARLPESGSAAVVGSVPTFSEPKAYRSEYSVQALAELKALVSGVAEATTVAAPDPVTPAPQVETIKPNQTQKVEAGRAALPDERLIWEWPASGKLLYSFAQGTNKKGLAIEGSPGAAVLAGAPGKVVYSGSGLRGYGRLIIVKHNATYLSVYAHNSELLVNEGQMVAKGQKIAVMGEISGGRTGLHFEIRRLGKPVNPLEFLPDRPS